jgi:tape measure domain-containing protein
VADSLGSAVLTLSVDDAAYQAGLRRAKQSADKTLGSIKGPNIGGGLFGDIGNEVSSLKGGLAAGALAATGAAVAVGAIGVALVQAAGNAQKLTAAFTGLTGSATAAAQLRQELFTLSKATPFRNDELLSAAQRFLAVGVEANKLGGTINRIGALAAQSGQSLDRVGLIYAQVFAKGRLQGEENLQFLEAGIDLNRQLAVVTGLSGEALQDAMSKGKISVNDVNAAIVLATGNMQALTGAGKSVSVAFDNIGDNIQQVFLGFAQAVTPALAAAFNVINKAFDRLFPSLESITKFFEPLASEAERFSKLLEKNPRVVEALALAFESLLNTGITPAIEGIAAINNGLEKQPQGLINSITELELKLRRSAFTASGLIKIITAPARLGGLLSGEARDQLLAGLGDIQKAFAAKEIDVPINVKPSTADVAGVAGDLSTKTQDLKNSIVSGAEALKKAAEDSAKKFIDASRQLLDARLKLSETQASSQGLNRFLAPDEAFTRTRAAITSLGPELEAALKRGGDLLRSQGVGIGRPLFENIREIISQARTGNFASFDGLQKITQFINDVNSETDAVTGVNTAQDQVNAINKELVGVNTSLRDQITALVSKAWNVQVNVDSTGQSTVYGDVVNSQLSPA